MTLAPREVVEAPAREWQHYPEYKDSGVEWLGEIPANWVVGKLGARCSVKARLGWKGLKASEYVDEGYIFLSTPNIKAREIDFKNVNYITANRYLESPEIMLQKGDVLIAKDGSTLGITNIIRELPKPSSVNGSIAVIRPQGPTNSVFLYYFLSSTYTQNVIQRMKGGMGVPHLFQADLRKFIVLVPDLHEQQAIATFLDQETVKIDDLIAKRERLIELLEEKRTALISQTVTKGLDPDVPMKDSGVEWLGEIPEHWETWKVAHAFRRVGSGTTPATNELAFYDGDVPWVTTSELREYVINDTSSKLTKRALKEHTALALYPPGTLLVAMYGATIGRLGILGIPACVNQACCALADPESLDVKFTFYWLLARRNDIIMASAGGGQPNINQEKIKSLRIPAPPLQEQRSIANFLDEQMVKIDALLSKVQEHIEKLREYRTALISAAVTGKIDVREEVSDPRGSR